MSINLNKSTATNFELMFPLIPTETSISATQSLVLNISDTVLPSMTLDTTDLNWMGAVAHQDIGAMTFDAWFVNYTVDSKFNNWITMYKWITFINNNKDKHGRNQSDYKVDAVLTIMDNFRKEILVIDIIGAWINMLGEVTLSYRDGTKNLESNINIMYDRFEPRLN